MTNITDNITAKAREWGYENAFHDDPVRRNGQFIRRGPWYLEASDYSRTRATAAQARVLNRLERGED